MMAVSVEEILSWEPCEEYTPERVAELFAGKATVTAIDIISMDITDNDKLWAVLREELIPAEILHEFACRVAETVLLKERAVGREPDPRSWAVIEAKRMWLKKEITDDELTAAREAARVAARVAARAAAWVATWAAEAAAGQVNIIRELLEGK